MNKMFPNHIKWNLKNLTCEICELAKHKRTTYVPSNNILTTSFMIVHYDVWCPSSNNSTDRVVPVLIDDCTQFIGHILCPIS